MGVMYSNPKNMLYNMYYNNTVDLILNKASADLRFNIRTHYHALNDRVHNWGVTLESPEFLNRVNPLEMKVRLLNHFNPPSPDMDLLTVFGFEAMINWYPDEANRDAYDINDRGDIVGVASDQNGDEFGVIWVGRTPITLWLEDDPGLAINAVGTAVGGDWRWDSGTVEELWDLVDPPPPWGGLPPPVWTFRTAVILSERPLLPGRTSMVTRFPGLTGITLTYWQRTAT